MELMRGGSVADVLRRDEDIGSRRALRWLREAASGLDAAHEAGVVHRDVKPANLLLDDHDRLGIGDFGIARLAWEEQVTQTGQVLGTAAYLAPEQALGEPATAASDRYALSVVAFELLTGEKPFNAEHFAAQARAHVEDDPPRASELNPDLTERVDAVIDRGMAKDPDDRWESAAEFVERLDESLAAPPPRRAPKAAAAGPTRSTRMMPGRAGTPPPRGAAAARRSGRQPPALGPGPARSSPASIGLLLAAALAFALLSGNGDGDGEQAGSGSTPTRRDGGEEGDRHANRDADRRRPSRRRAATRDRRPRPTGAGRAHRRRAGRQRPRCAPAPGVQPQQGRQVRGGPARRAEGREARLQGRRRGEPLRLRPVRARQGAARDRRPRRRGQDAGGAPAALSRRPAGRGRGRAQEGQVGRRRGKGPDASQADTPVWTREYNTPAAEDRHRRTRARRAGPRRARPRRPERQRAVQRLRLHGGHVGRRRPLPRPCAQRARGARGVDRDDGQPRPVGDGRPHVDRCTTTASTIRPTRTSRTPSTSPRSPAPTSASGC